MTLVETGRYIFLVVYIIFKKKTALFTITKKQQIKSNIYIKYQGEQSFIFLFKRFYLIFFLSIYCLPSIPNKIFIYSYFRIEFNHIGRVYYSKKKIKYVLVNV